MGFYFRKMKIYVHTKTCTWMFKITFILSKIIFSMYYPSYVILLQLIKNKGHVPITILMTCEPRLKGSHLNTHSWISWIMESWRNINALQFPPFPAIQTTIIKIREIANFSYFFQDANSVEWLYCKKLENFASSKLFFVCCNWV